jgi:hypothetical protein
MSWIDYELRREDEKTINRLQYQLLAEQATISRLSERVAELEGSLKTAIYLIRGREYTGEIERILNCVPKGCRPAYYPDGTRTWCNAHSRRLEICAATPAPPATKEGN